MANNENGPIRRTFRDVYTHVASVDFGAASGTGAAAQVEIPVPSWYKKGEWAVLAVVCAGVTLSIDGVALKSDGTKLVLTVYNYGTGCCPFPYFNSATVILGKYNLRFLA